MGLLGLDSKVFCYKIYATSLNLDLWSELEGTKDDRCVRLSAEIVKYLDSENKNNTIYSH